MGYRLTAADYSNGDYYHYGDKNLGQAGYDAVGNRLTQTSMVSGLSSTVNYTYDDANRLASVNAVNYTWDDNGNLLSDGVNTYTYDSANRLKTMTSSEVAASYVYNGMGDRLQETLNGQTTTFTMDYNQGLTQALSDGTNTYLYGNGRIAQVNTGTEYFLGDALGSVRQLTNATGVVNYASAYDPYGVTTRSYGVSQTAYGYTNEYASQGLIYLRSRFYFPGIGRFLTRDTWDGIYSDPITLNRWAYVRDNPVLRTDPSGHCDILCIIAILIVLGIVTQGCSPTPIATPNPTPVAIVGFPNVTISNPQDWSNAEIAELTSIIKDKIVPAFGNSPATFANAVGNISVMVVPDHSLTDNGKEASARSPFDKINFEHRIFSPPDVFGIIHEFGHQFDWQGHESNAQKLQWRSQQFVDNPAINTSGCTGDRLQCRNTYTDQNNNGRIYYPSDAYANAFAAYILGPSSPIKYQAEKLTIIQNDIQGVP